MPKSTGPPCGPAAAGCRVQQYQRSQDRTAKGYSPPPSGQCQPFPGFRGPGPDSCPCERSSYAGCKACPCRLELSPDWLLRPVISNRSANPPATLPRFPSYFHMPGRAPTPTPNPQPPTPPLASVTFTRSFCVLSGRFLKRPDKESRFFFLEKKTFS